MAFSARPSASRLECVNQYGGRRDGVVKDAKSLEVAPTSTPQLARLGKHTYESPLVELLSNYSLHEKAMVKALPAPTLLR